MISISHDLELISARGEGEKGRGGKGRGKGEKKRGGEKESFLHFRGLPTPSSVQLPHCHTAMHFRERVGGKEGKRGGKGRKREEKGGKKGEKRGKRRGKGRGKRKRPHLRPLKIFRGLRPRTPPSAGGAQS